MEFLFLLLMFYFKFIPNTPDRGKGPVLIIFDFLPKSFDMHIKQF